MTTADRDRWDAKYAAAPPRDVGAPEPWIVERVEALRPGRALDVACGLGRHALWLASQGWLVDAVDVSPVGLAQARRVAEERGVSVNWITADLDVFVPEVDSYDLIVVVRFLDRTLAPRLTAALRPGGVLLYETFTAAQLARPDNHLQSATYSLDPGELPRLFPRLQIEEFAELTLADRTVARLRASQPAS